jgi:hypothetical protein
MISIPFSPEMAAAMIDGIKCCTSRSKAYGGPGYLISINGATFRILDVHLHPLQYIRDHLYRIEGFSSPEAFEHTWRQLHRGNFLPDKIYHVHYLARADGGNW